MKKSTPAYSKSLLMQIAFRDFIMWLWSEPAMRRAFENDTGMPPIHDTGRLPTPIDLLIDKVAGVHEKYAEAFVEWAIKTQWGEE